MKILLVEDEPKLGAATKRGLELDGYSVELVTNADDALSYTAFDQYDLIIMDRMLPGGKDGLDICAQLREKDDPTPILMLTALGEITDKVAGLKNGADDYLVKPFAFDELIARTHALLRRPHKLVGPKMNINGLQIDMGDKRVSRDGHEIKLTKKEYSLLEYLVINKDHTISKEQLIEHVWDFEADILPNTVEVFIRSLRNKLGDTNNSIIKTVRGFGYRIEV